MKWIKILIIILIIYGFTKQPGIVSSVQYQDPHLNEIKRVQAFLQRYNSPLQNNATDFVHASVKYHLDWRLLPTVACVESSCGKNYKNNPFGWGSDTISYGSTSENIFTIARKINTLSYYKTFRETGLLRDFALAYNNPNASEYVKKLNYFYDQL